MEEETPKALYALAALIVGLVLLAAKLVFASCGSSPARPSTPAGCYKIKAQCVCDDDGRNCYWQWVCLDREDD